MQIKDQKFDVVVERAPCLGGDVALAGFVAKCAALEVEGHGATKDLALGACEKAILQKLLAGPVVEAVLPAADAKTEPPPVKKAKG